MSAPQRVSKENFRLLDLSSSESLSEDLHLEITPSRKKKVTRRERNRNVTRLPESNATTTEMRLVGRWALRLFIFIWLLALTWLMVSLYDQITTMQININKVTTSSSDVGTDLQRCHTAAKELKYNVTDLNDRVTELELSHKELHNKVEQACSELAAVTKQLAAAPKLADTPRRLGELQRTVANFGSQLSGFDASFASAREQALSATTGLNEVKASLHELEERVNETIANSKNNEELRKDINSVNSTLVQRIDALSARIEDTNKPSSTMAPSTSSSTTPSTTTSSTTTTTQTSASESPAKPVVTQ